MDEFSYLSILISIVLGLGLANLLTGLASLIRARASTKMYWPVPVWIVTLFLILMQTWWAMFVLRGVSHWNFLGFFVVLMQPVLLYMATALIAPQMADSSDVDLRLDYHRHARWFFAVLAGDICVSLAKDFILYGHFLRRENLISHFVFLVLAALGFSTKSELVHKVAAPLTLTLSIIYIGWLFFTLEGG